MDFFDKLIVAADLTLIVVGIISILIIRRQS